ncbi:MATE family efflux transporter [Novosphingobium sp. 1949]|uniref:MATE family efflux transporter n=1 Tax=Novosphingobium organovorum TaxID=2930092 RepID=A0ABT0BFS9_9SPHN|nr:MATE family efflux transporter [Novosphingobium organovorum]MCJ2183898.1 MATE family efflux transporter [Novosphingobium organovorum]
MNEAAPIPEGEWEPGEETAHPPVPAGGKDAARRGDLTQGPILKTLLLFSIPMLISNVLQTLNGSVNAIWVGRLIGESALAATANANVIMFLLIAAVFGFSMATTVRVGQFFGARDIDAARRTFGSGVGFCMGIAALTGIVGWIFAAPLLDLMSTPDASKIEALDYLRVVFITLPLGAVSMMVSMAMRGAGDARTPLYAMILVVALDIVLNPLLIIGPGPIPTLGITGSAMSTAFANSGGLAFLVWRIYRQDLPMRLRGPELGYLIPRREELRYIVTKGLPMGAQILLVSSASLIMIGLVNREGLNTSAAYGASLQLWNYLQMPAFAMGSAVSAMVAQALGAGNHRRVSAVANVGMATNFALTSVMAAVLVAFDHPLLALFLGGDSPAMPIAQHMQLVCTASYVIISITMIIQGTLRAYGVVLAPLVIMFLGLYPGRLGFYHLAYPLIGSEALWWAFPVGSLITVVLAVAYYRLANWGKSR